MHGDVAVIFTNQRTEVDEAGYAATAERMETLAAARPGYRGITSVRDAAGLGITVSYWATEADARAWKEVAEHLAAQRDGRERWYEWYTVRVATIEREYSFRRPQHPATELFHVALPADWDAAMDTGVYAASTRGRTFADDGFIHCSHADQVDATIGRFYADVPEIVVLTIDAESLDVPVVEEDLLGTGELFPHVYGPIPLTAVTSAERRRTRA